MTDRPEDPNTAQGAGLSATDRAAVARRLQSRLPQVTASPLRDAVVAAEADASRDPLPGDLWRLTWDTTALLVLVVDLSDSVPLVAPISINPPAGDERTVILPAETHILGVTAAAWVGLVRKVPLRVFDANLGRVQPSLLAAARAILAGDGPEAQADVELGQPVISPFSLVAEVSADLEDGLEHLASAHWVPTRAVPAQTIPEILDGRAELEDLLQVLGTTPGRAWDLWCGDRALQPQEAETVARRFGVSADALLAAATLPDDLVAELDKPAWRPELRARKTAFGLDDREVRLDAAYGCRAPARTTGAGAGQWAQRLRQYFDTHPVPEGQP